MNHKKNFLWDSVVELLDKFEETNKGIAGMTVADLGEVGDPPRIMCFQKAVNRANLNEFGILVGEYVVGMSDISWIATVSVDVKDPDMSLAVDYIDNTSKITRDEIKNMIQELVRHLTQLMTPATIDPKKLN